MEEFIRILDNILIDELDYILHTEYGVDSLDKNETGDELISELEYNLNTRCGLNSYKREIWKELMSEWGWRGIIFGIGLFKLLDCAVIHLKKEDVNLLLPGFDIKNLNESKGFLLKLSDSVSNYLNNYDNQFTSIEALSNINQYSYDEDYDEFIRIEESIVDLLCAYIFSFHENIQSIFNYIGFFDQISRFSKRERLSKFLKKLNEINISKNYFSSLSTFIDTVNIFIEELSNYKFTYYDILNQPGRNQLYRDEDILRDEILVELLFLNTNLENYDNINIYVPCCDNIANISKSIEIIKLQNNACNINFYGKLNFKNSLFDTTRVIFYSFEYDNIFLSSSREIGFPFEYCSLENMDFIISDYIPKDIYDDGNFIHEFQNKLNYSSKLVMIIDKEQYSNNYINFIVLNDNLESIITFDNFFILVLNSNKSDDKKNKFLLSDYTLLDRNYINNLKQYKKKSLEKIGIYRYKMYNQYILKSFVNVEHMNNILEVCSCFSNTNFSKVILNNHAVNNVYQFENRKNWGEYYLNGSVESDGFDIDDFIELDEIDSGDLVDVDEIVELENFSDIYSDINFYLENFNFNNLIYDLKRKHYLLVKQRYVGNKHSEIIEEKLEFVPLYSLITFDINEIEDEREIRKIEKYDYCFYVKSDKILRDFLVYYLDSEKGKEEYNFLKNGFGYENLDIRYIQSQYTTRCEFLYMRIPLVDIETQKNVIKAFELNEEHYNLVKKSRDNFKSNILNYEKVLKDMENFHRMEIDTKTGEIVEMNTVKRHMFDGLLWPLSISYLNAVHGTHVSNPNEKLDFYLKLFEFLTAFIVIILISAIPEEEYENLKYGLWKGISDYRDYNVVFGTWTTLYHKLLNLYNDIDIKPKFNNILIEKFLNKDIYNIMDEARVIRNEFPGHGASIRESRAKQLVDDLKLKIDIVYDIFGYFTGFKLFYSIKVLDLLDDGSNLYEVVSLNGPCDQPIYGKVTFNKRLKKNTFYLNNSLDGDLLELNNNLILFEEVIESYLDKGQKKERATGKFNLYLFNGFSKRRNNVRVKYKCYQIETDEFRKNISFEDWDKLM